MSPFSLDPQSRDLLIRTVYGEAGNQSPDGQAAVANVVMNRLKSGQFGKSVQDVVFAPNQFEPWGTRRQELLGLNPDSPAYRAAAAAVDGIFAANAQDNTFGATHFLNPEIVRQRRGGSLPGWAQGNPTATIGAHSFYSPQTGPGRSMQYATQQQPPRVAVVEDDPSTWGAELVSSAQSLPPANRPTVTVRPTTTNDLQQTRQVQQQRPQIVENDPSTWGAELVSQGGNFDRDMWTNADGTELPFTAAPLTNQRTPLDAQKQSILARETQNPNPTIARNARVEQHIGDGTPEALRNALMSNPLTAALSQVFPAEMVVHGLGYGLSDEMLAFLKSKVTSDDHQEILKANRERMQRTRNEQPIASVAGEVSGNLLTTPAAAGLNLFKGATALPRLGNSMLSGGALSGLYGFNTGEGMDQRLQQMWQQGLLGAGLSVLGEGAVSGITALLRRGFGANRATAANVNPQQRIAENAEFNIPLTAGEATGNLRQQGWENAARNNARGTYPGTQMQAFDSQRTQAITTAADETIGSQFGPRIAAEEAGDMTARAMRDRAALLRADSEAAYQRAADKNAWIAADEVTNLAQRVTQDLETAGIRLDTYGNYPGAHNAMNLLRRVSGFEGAPQGEQVVAQSLGGLEQVRKGLLQIRPGSGEDKRAVDAIKRQFDNWVSDAIDKRLFQGDATALDDLRAARSLWSQYKGMTASKEGPMQVISKMVNEERTGAEVANWLLSSSTVGQAGNSARVAAQVKRMVGATSDEWQGIRAAAWDRVVNDATGNPRNAQQIAKAIDDLTRGNGKALARQLYSGSEIGQMQRLAGAIRNTATDPRAFNPSRSGYEVVRAMSDKLGIAAFSAMGAGTSWFMGDPRWFAMTAIPVLRSAGNATKLNAALRPTPSTWGQTAGEIARLPQRSIPALLSSGNQ